MFHLSILFFCIISSFQALECFLSCGDFDNCDQPRCGGICEGSEEFSRLTFTTEECNTDEDRCIFREFLFLDSESNSTKSMHIPGGCLLNYERSLENVGNYLFEEGVRLVACEGNLCNEPPVPSCDGLTQLLGCLLDLDNLFELLTDSTQLRGGSADDRRGFCLNSELLEEFNEQSPCFGITGPNALPSPSTCTSLAEIDNIATLTCQECADSLDCDINQTVELPDNDINATLSPTNATFTPTITPTKSPSFSPHSSPPQGNSTSLKQVLSEELLYTLIGLSGFCLCISLFILAICLTRTKKEKNDEDADGGTESVAPEHELLRMIEDAHPGEYLTELPPFNDSKRLESVEMQKDVEMNAPASKASMATLEETDQMFDEVEF